MPDPLFDRYGKSAPAGEVLFAQGDPGGEMYILRSGAVRIYVLSDHTEKTLAVLRSGDFVGEMSLLTGRPRSATAIVDEDASLIVVNGPLLEEMIISNTEIALRLLRKLAMRLEMTDSLTRVLLLRDPNDRVIENFRRLAELHGWTEGSAISLQANYEELAEQIGLETTEVKEVISRLIRAGAIKEMDGAWTIHAPERLEEVLRFLKMKQQFR